MHRFIIALLFALTISCSMLADLAMDSVSGSKGGINTELVVGDKEQVLGTNLEVDAKNVGKVVGNNDNSTAIASAKEVQINNNALPLWVMFVLITLAGLVGWLAPRPHVWKRLIRNKQ